MFYNKQIVANSCIVQVSQVYLLLTTCVKCNNTVHQNTLRRKRRGQYTSNWAVRIQRLLPCCLVMWLTASLVTLNHKGHISTMKDCEEVDISHVAFSNDWNFHCKFFNKITDSNLNLCIDLVFLSPHKTSLCFQSSLSFQWSSGLLYNLFLWLKGSTWEQ